jgi:hypothetical protein
MWNGKSMLSVIIMVWLGKCIEMRYMVRFSGYV